MKTADELLPVITQERDQFRTERDQLRAKLAEYEKAHQWRKFPAPSLERIFVAGVPSRPSCDGFAGLSEQAVYACNCERCRTDKGVTAKRMYVCPTCGNKRCPAIQDHRFKCTGSNELDQVGVLKDSEGPGPSSTAYPVPTPVERRPKPSGYVTLAELDEMSMKPAKEPGQ